MSSDPVIRVEGLTKSYAIYERPHHRLLQVLFPNTAERWYREFHALSHVSLEIGKGESVGIVGRNGSGKSTLLQIICGTLTPTAGRVEVRGRVAALLELGAGFNAEFTGRENVFLNGAVLGLGREEIERRFDAIAAFADIGEFMDQPVKTYSSGMYIRLAFSVAINIEPDILVVDEALSVGDEAFQRKCYARIQSLRDRGATVLFVSHSAGTVLELCDRAVLLDRGECLAVGEPKHVITRYHKLLFSTPEAADKVRASLRAEAAGQVIDSVVTERDDRSTTQHEYFDPSMVPQSTVVYPSAGAEILDPHVETPSGRRVNLLRAGAVYHYTYQVRFTRAAFAVRCGMLIKTPSGLELAGGVSAQAGDAMACVEVGAEIAVRFEFRCLLAPGVYFINAGVLGVVGDAEEYLDRRIDVAMFRVLPDEGRLSTGYVDLDIRPSLQVA
jgi:lipopolysaccharide transport system ATP-binding protein